jgi:hypothetical protein
LKTLGHGIIVSLMERCFRNSGLCYADGIVHNQRFCNAAKRPGAAAWLALIVFLPLAIAAGSCLESGNAPYE